MSDTETDGVSGCREVSEAKENRLPAPLRHPLAVEAQSGTARHLTRLHSSAGARGSQAFSLPPRYALI